MVQSEKMGYCERVRERKTKEERDATPAFRKCLQYSACRWKGQTRRQLAAALPRSRSEFFRGIRCSGMWRCIAGLAGNDVSKKPATFIFCCRRFQEETLLRWKSQDLSKYLETQTPRHGVTALKTWNFCLGLFVSHFVYNSRPPLLYLFLPNFIHPFFCPLNIHSFLV